MSASSGRRTKNDARREREWMRRNSWLLHTRAFRCSMRVEVGGGGGMTVGVSAPVRDSRDRMERWLRWVPAREGEGEGLAPLMADRAPGRPPKAEPMVTVSPLVVPPMASPREVPPPEGMLPYPVAAMADWRLTVVRKITLWCGVLGILLGFLSEAFSLRSCLAAALLAAASASAFTSSAGTDTTQAMSVWKTSGAQVAVMVICKGEGAGGGAY